MANQPGGYTDLAPLMGDTFDLEHHSGYVIKRFDFFSTNEPVHEISNIVEF